MCSFVSVSADPNRLTVSSSQWHWHLFHLWPKPLWHILISTRVAAQAEWDPTVDADGHKFGRRRRKTNLQLFSYFFLFRGAWRRAFRCIYIGFNVGSRCTRWMREGWFVISFGSACVMREGLWIIHRNCRLVIPLWLEFAELTPILILSYSRGELLRVMGIKLAVILISSAFKRVLHLAGGVLLWKNNHDYIWWNYDR